MRHVFFRYQFTRGITALSVSALVIAAGGILFSLFKLFGAFGLRSFSIPADIASTAICGFIAFTVTFVLFFSKYKIDEGGLRLSMFLLRQEIPLKSIQYIIENTEDKRMCVYYTVRAADQTDTVGYTFLPINIHRQKNDAFVKALRKMNTAIEYRSFTKDDFDDPSE